MDEQEIYLLIIRYLNLQTTQEENEFLADWLTASSANEQTFEEIKSVWSASKAIPNAEETEAALNKLHLQLNLPSNGNLKPIRKRNPLSYIMAAAAVLIICGIATFVYVRKPGKSVVSYVKIATHAGQKLQLSLEDGTHIYLAPSSTLTYPEQFSPGHREVYLTGQAMFEVAKDAHRPFTVHCDSLGVRVLGTRFNVSDIGRHRKIVVSLMQGKVEVLSNSIKACHFFLAPGQRLTYDQAENQFYRDGFDEREVTGWIRNELVFRNERLGDAAIRIEQMYGVRFVFSSKKVASIRVYASFYNDSLKTILNELKAAGDIDYNIDNDIIYLTESRPLTPKTTNR